MAEWLIAVAAVVVLVVLALGVRRMRRRVWEGIMVNADPARIWGVMTDYAHFPEWRPDIERVEVNPGGDGWIAHHKDGLTYEYAVERAEPGRRIRWRYGAILPGDEAPGARGAWSVQIQPRPGGSRVRSRVLDDRSAGSLWRRLIDALGGPRTHQRLYLECLKRRAEHEHGETDLPRSDA